MVKSLLFCVSTNPGPPLNWFHWLLLVTEHDKHVEAEYLKRMADISMTAREG